MTSASGNEGAGGKLGTGSPGASDRFACQADVDRLVDDEAFGKVRSGDHASLQGWFHDDPKAALEWVTEAHDPAIVPTLVDLLRDEAIVHFHMAEALEQITDDPDRKSWAITIKRTEAAQVESFPPRADIPEDVSAIQTLVEDGTRESFWRAFRTNPWLASVLLANDVKVVPALRQTAESNLAFLLQEQAKVQLSMALALARTADETCQKIRAAPRVPIHPDLPVIASHAQTAPVPRTDTTQQTPPGPTAAPSPDFDLATASLTPTVSADRRTRTGLAPEQESCENVNSSRQHLKAAAGCLAQLDPGLFEHGELLKVTAELNVAFSNIVDRLLRPEIELIEHSFNEQLMSRGSATLAEKQDLSKWANAELRAVGLAIRCPKTGRPSTLLAGPGNQPIVGRFQLQHKGVDGKWKRPLSTPTLPYLRLMPDLPSLDVDLASVLGRLAGDRVGL